MAGDREARRLRVMKLRGTKAFSEGKLTEATHQYLGAMQLQTELDLKCGTRQNDDFSPKSEDITKCLFPSQSTAKQDVGIHSVLRTVVIEADKGIKLTPTRPKPYISKATALILQNSWEAAREVYLEGINKCDDCLAIRSALEKLDRMDNLLQTIPSLLERTQRTKSTSSDTSESTTSITSPTSPVSNKRKFRLQHRKKLSRPMVHFFVTTSGRLKSTDDYGDDDDDDNDETQDTWL